MGATMLAMAVSSILVTAVVSSTLATVVVSSTLAMVVVSYDQARMEVVASSVVASMVASSTLAMVGVSYEQTLMELVASSVEVVQSMEEVAPLSCEQGKTADNPLWVTEINPMESLKQTFNLSSVPNRRDSN